LVGIPCLLFFWQMKPLNFGWFGFLKLRPELQNNTNNRWSTVLCIPSSPAFLASFFLLLLQMKTFNFKRLSMFEKHSNHTCYCEDRINENYLMTWFIIHFLRNFIHGPPGRHDIQHNGDQHSDIQHNITQHKGLINTCNAQHKWPYHNNTVSSAIMPSLVKLSVAFHYWNAQCCYAGCQYAEYHYSECYCVECWGAPLLPCSHKGDLLSPIFCQN